MTLKEKKKWHFIKFPIIFDDSMENTINIERELICFIT